MATTCYQELDAASQEQVDAAIYLIGSHIYPLDDLQEDQLQDYLANLVLSCLSIKQKEEAASKKKGKGRVTHQEEVMISLSTFEMRVVHTTKKRPQVGYIHYEGKKRRVFVDFWNEQPVWKLVNGSGDEQEYDYCAQKTMPIEDDPDDDAAEETELEEME